MTNDEIQRVIDLLRKKQEAKREESAENAFERRGHEAAGFVFGLAYAIGALEARMGEE